MLSNDCRTAIVELQMNLRTKESKLAGYRRKDLKGTIEACTTYPAESMNCSLKHKSSKVNSTLNLDTSINRIIDGIVTRLGNRRKQALMCVMELLLFIKLCKYPWYTK